MQHIISREEHSDLLRRVARSEATEDELRVLIAAGVAAQVIINATVVVEHDKLLVITHTVMGDGVPGIIKRLEAVELEPKNKSAKRIAVFAVVAAIVSIAVSIVFNLLNFFKG